MALPVLRRGHAVEQRDGAARQRRSPVAEWSPWRELAELHERMGRLLAADLGDPAVGDPAVGDPDPRQGGWRPPADVEETAEAYVVEIELPGVRREDVAVEFGNGELTVSGEMRERERVGFLRTRTRRVGHFDYRVHLPADVESDQVSASLTDGVLTVRAPKAVTARPRRIPVTG